MKLTKYTVYYIAVIVLGIAALISFCVTNGIGGYAVENGGWMIFVIIASMVIVAAAYVCGRLFNIPILIKVGSWVALILLSLVVYELIASRANVAGTLFTFDSNNEVGWKAFKTAIVCGVFVILTELLLIVGAFFTEKPAKAAEAAEA